MAVRIACNLQDGRLISVLRDLGLIDLTLHVPRAYSSHFNLPRILETDYKNAQISPKDQARLHAQYARENDILIAPDYRPHKDETIIRISAYLTEIEELGLNNTVLITPQGRDVNEWLECYDELRSMRKGKGIIIGIPFILTEFVKNGRKRRNGKHYPNYDLLRELVSEVKEPFHMLGWSFTYHAEFRDVFLRAYSVDSSSVIHEMRRYGKSCRLRIDGRWEVKNHRQYYLLPFQVRVIEFLSDLRVWLDPSQSFREEHSLERWMIA